MVATRQRVTLTTKCSDADPPPAQRSRVAQAAAFVLTGGLMGLVELTAPWEMTLLGRFVPGGGWVMIPLLAAYAAWLTGVMLAPRRQPVWRRRVWLFFSIVFFTQLALGLAGWSTFLMTGELHLPVPALIVAGPLYRGEGFFMLILFLVTVLAVGPAWCSHLCYIGAWDSAASSARRRPKPLPGWTRWARIGLLVGVFGTAVALHAAGVSAWVAASLGLAFGLAGVAVMFLLSRRAGSMVHCTVYCPIGLVANVLGKVSPWRIRIGSDCDACGACTLACRYDALSADDIARKKPALSCTLCGDCVGSCAKSSIQYAFGPFAAHPRWRTAFIVVVVSLHAICLATARI